jgi:hypothetical protein
LLKSSKTPEPIPLGAQIGSNRCLYRLHPKFLLTQLNEGLSLSAIAEKDFWRFRRLMKNLKTFLMIGATVALLALPVAATNLITVSDNSVQDDCVQEKKDANYAEFLKIYKTDQAKAFDLAKKYLACPAAGEVTEAQQKIIDFLKKWSTAYEEGMLKVTFTDELYNKKNVKVLVDMGANGFVLLPVKNAQLNAESLDYARRALQALESGKTVDDWGPLVNKDNAVAYLNFTIGAQSLEKDPGTALKHLLKSAQLESPLKKSPFTYAYIAGAYETGAYAKQSEAYKATYGGKDETPESKLALANINQIVDRMIDAYARAVALAGTEAQYATVKAQSLESLTTWWKYRNNNTDAGMNEFIASVTTKPLPPEPSPITVLPASTPAATPAATGTPTTGNGTASTTAPGGTQPASKAPTGTTQPASKTTPAASTPAKPAGTKPGTPDKPRR